MRTTVAAAGAVLGLTLALSGCGPTFGPTFGLNERAEQSYDVTGEVTAVEIGTGSGDVMVAESGRSGIRVTESLRWRGNRPTGGHRVDGDTLRLEYDCGACSIDYRVDVPRGLAVHVETGSGSITLRDLTGRVTASTGSGDIDTRELAGEEVSAETGSGEVRLRFAEAPREVSVETGSGDAEVSVPDGAYRVTAETGSGERSVEIAHDRAASRRIVVKAGSGDVAVRRR